MNLRDLTIKLGLVGWLANAEAEKLAELSINKDVVEIGSFCGLSSYCIAIAAKSLLCVDTFKAGGGGQAQQKDFTTLDVFKEATKRFSNVRFLAMTSKEASEITNEEFGFVFVDAMHTYPEVTQDIDLWWPKLEAGGVMAFHDYGGFPEVIKAVNERFTPFEIVHSMALVRKD